MANTGRGRTDHPRDLPSHSGLGMTHTDQPTQAGRRAGNIVSTVGERGKQSHLGRQLEPFAKVFAKLDLALNTSLPHALNTDVELGDLFGALQSGQEAKSQAEQEVHGNTNIEKGKEKTPS